MLTPQKAGALVADLLTLQNQVRLYHWQTESHARHKATDALYTGLDALIDRFVETLMGAYGRPQLQGASARLTLHNMNDRGDAAIRWLQNTAAYLSTELPAALDPARDTDLLNIRDEMLGLVRQTLYLFTLH